MPTESALFGAVTRTDGIIAAMALAVFALSILCVWLFLSLRKTTANRDELIAMNLDMEAATKAKGKFLVAMSHEIQTPMNALTSFIEILIQRSLQNCSLEHKEETEGILDIIKKSNSDILTIINDVFGYIKIDANLLEIESVPMSIRQLVHDICLAEKPNVIAKHLGLSVQYSGEIPPTILSDPVCIRQILLQLISNAIRFTDKGTITVVCEALPGGNSHTPTHKTNGNHQGTFSVSPMQLKISVTDTGIGIPASHIQELFKPFKRMDSHLLHPKRGTGLGLNIAMRLATLLDGTITVESTLGQGSTFSLLLTAYVPKGTPPALDGEHKELREDSRLHVGLDIRQQKEHTEVSPDETKPLRNLRVLVVEDAAVNQVIMATFLREAGAQVELADNGAMGVQKVMQNMDNGLFFDVVLMDMRMPVMDGYEAVAYLRKYDYRRPIIAVTALTSAGDRDKTLKAGCDDYIAKPVNHKAMIEMIKKHAGIG